MTLKTKATVALACTVSAVCILGASHQAFGAINYSPVGNVWDCSLSGGGQKGLAMINFNDDGTFTGFQILSTIPRTVQKPDPTYGRTPNGNAGRGGAVAPPVAPPVVINHTNLFGFAHIDGSWRYDLKGRVVGFYTIRVTVDGGETYDTQGIGVLAKVSPNKKITIIASTPSGSVTYTGVPAKEMPDLSGSWYGTKVKNKQKLQEFFSLSSFALDNPWAEAYPELSTFPNVYFTSDGMGPGYNFIGIAMYSSRKQVAFAFQASPDVPEDPEDPDAEVSTTLSAVLGSISIRKTFTKVSATGIEEPNNTISYTAAMTAE